MARAVSEQILDELRVDRHAGEAGRPADDVELVIVHLAGVRLRAVLDQQPDHRQIAALGGEVERERVVPFVADVGIGAALRAAPGRPAAWATPKCSAVRSPLCPSSVPRWSIRCPDARRAIASTPCDVAVARRRAAARGAPARVAKRRARVGDRRLAARSQPAKPYSRASAYWTSRSAGRRPARRARRPRAAARASGSPRAQRLQPALRFFSETFEGGVRGERTRQADTFFPLSLGCPKSAELRAGRRFGADDEPAGWEQLPCRGQEAPQRALRGSLSNNARKVNWRRASVRWRVDVDLHDRTTGGIAGRIGELEITDRASDERADVAKNASHPRRSIRRQ